jgi:hypothetical protein
MNWRRLNLHDSMIILFTLLPYIYAKWYLSLIWKNWYAQTMPSIDKCCIIGIFLCFNFIPKEPIWQLTLTANSPSGEPVLTRQIDFNPTTWVISSNLGFALVPAPVRAYATVSLCFLIYSTTAKWCPVMRYNSDASSVVGIFWHIKIFFSIFLFSFFLSL